MKIETEYIAQARAASGVASETLDVPEGATVKDVLTCAAGLHTDKLAGLLLSGDGSASKSILLFRGDDQVDPDTPLKEGDRLTILSPLAGG